MTAYGMRISDWSSDVCSSDLRHAFVRSAHRQLAIFSIAEFDRVLGVGPNHDRYFEIFRKLALLDQRVHPRETAPAAEDAVLILLALDSGANQILDDEAGLADHSFQFGKIGRAHV